VNEVGISIRHDWTRTTGSKFLKGGECRQRGSALCRREMLKKPVSVLWDKMSLELEQACKKEGVVGYSLVDFATGKRLGFLDDVTFPTASTIKIAILLALAQKVHEGNLAWDQRVRIGDSSKVYGSGILSHLRYPLDMAVWDVATLMIALSDNDATNICIDFVGMEYTNRLLDSLGLPNTRLRRKMMDAQAVKRGDENVSTPRELTELLVKIHRGEGIPGEVARDVLEILELPKDGPFGKALPSKIRRVNKPGGLSHVSVDAGIVYIPERPFALAVMGSFLTEGDKAVVDVIRTAYGYMDLIARCTEYGRA